MARLVRYFGQTPEYWLDNCTYPDWTEIWNRELRNAPPPEDFLAGYFGYEAPDDGTQVAEEVEPNNGLPEFEE